MCPKAAEWESGAYLAKPAWWMYDKTEQTSISEQSLTELHTKVEKHIKTLKFSKPQRCAAKEKRELHQKARKVYLSVARRGDRSREKLTYAQRVTKIF